ncbi:pyridoxamine 5'-phosphate oxidase family protein [Aquabacter cavernae]|uniref:pyridoxamine 5'-phosphate oxidase family protein n=1 Tax=Aquabacter cavernae TaxID=2496029 RepID=UPI000F8E329C|nr:pyridoxamine 5'-phosphate oxidase family protein [Aquabacter cavernae]
MSRVDTAEALRSLYDQPKGRSVAKELTWLDPHCRRFIALSPFVLLATCDIAGHADVSPRGDHAGFVAVEDDRTLLLPDRPGNNRLDSLENIIANPAVGLLFLIPGIDETLRVNGQGEIRADADLTARFAIGGRQPTTVLRVRVEQAYLHCAKAFMRSRLWDPDARLPRTTLPSMGEMLKDQIGLQGPAETQAEMLTRYRDLLY